MTATSVGGGVETGASFLASVSTLPGPLAEEVESRTTLLSSSSIGCAFDVLMHGTTLDRNDLQRDFLRVVCFEGVIFAAFGDDADGLFSGVASLDPAPLPLEDAPGSREVDGAEEASVASVPPGTSLFSIVFSSSAVVTLGGDFSSRGPLGASVDMDGTRGGVQTRMWALGIGRCLAIQLHS